jgi:RNA polymerase sigma-54 factor
MKQAAESLGVNESTVSRTVAGKYAETPQGVLPLKNFFSTGVNSQSGEDVSNQAVMEKIRQLIAQEDPSSPLSDEAIAGLLKKSGIPVARRTVAKYRDILKIPSSSLRKKFF